MMAYMQPAQNVREVQVLLGKLRAHCPMQGVTPGEAKVLFDDYLGELMHCPEWAIRDACKKYRSIPENRFFPSLAQLMTLVKLETWKITSQIRAIEKILAKEAGKEQPKPDLSNELSKLAENLMASKPPQEPQKRKDYSHLPPREEIPMPWKQV